MQACGAACLAKFCSEKGIGSTNVDGLIEHLLLLLACTDLPAWESSGAGLELSGRGDPLPDSLVNSLTPDLARDFQRLIESVVEIGLVDMYGAVTDLPAKFLAESQRLLESNGVQPPKPEELFPEGGKEDLCGWGEPMIESEYRVVRERFLEMLARRKPAF
ncbi:MAG: hypothetical protein AAF657_09470 [Acidobacteriota bacterium]